MSSVGIPYLQPPATIVGQALDALGVSDSKMIGDLSDGTPVSEAARRNYGQVLRQLLRANHWPFARRMAKLTLLGDATGQTQNVSNFVECPWTYSYAWPIDGVQGRWMPFTFLNGPTTGPMNGNIPLTPPGVPLVPYQQQPARFLVSSSDQYPVQTGVVPWLDLPDLQRTEGLGPQYRKIILTNCCNAWFVYTRLVTVIEEWDDGFRAAMVALMAITLAPVAIDDPKLRTIERDKQAMMAKGIIADARAMASNEAGYPMSTDFEASFIRARNRGGYGGYGGYGAGGVSVDGIGYFGCGFESFSVGGSVF